MKNWISFSLIGLVSLALVTGCSRHTEEDGHAEHGDHAGHAHGDASVPKQPGFCSEHNLKESECGACHPEKLPTLKPGESMKVRLPDKNSGELVGVTTEPALVGEALEIEECFAELAFDQTRTAQITAPVGGIVEEVTVDTGSVVTEHQSVARLWSASIAEAVAKAVLSHQTLQREKMLRASRVTPAKDLEQAEADHRSACQHLRTFGFTEEQIDDLAQKPQERVLLDVRTPFAGEIVQRDAVRGSLVEAGKPLFTMADCSTIWAWVSIPEATLPRVALGQTVKLKVDSLPGKTFEGKLTWISPELEPRSRMARARAVFPNPDRSLKARMFARAGIVTQRTGNAVLLTNDAVQKINGESFAFVKIDDDLYEARAVKTGVSFDGRIQVIEGLRGGEPVAVQHAFAVKSALLISRLGAGCGAD